MANLEAAVYKDGVIEMPKCDYNFNGKGIGQKYFESMFKFKDRIMQIDAVTEEKQTYGFVLQRSIRAALKMQSLGVQENDIITTCSFNSLDSCIPNFSAFFLGVIVTNLDPRMPFIDALHLLKQINVKLIFADEGSVAFIEKLLQATGKTTTVVVFGHSDQHINFSEFVKPVSNEHLFLPVEVDPNETAFIMFSSGSTGLPKGICLSHQAHLQQVAIAIAVETSYNRMLSFATLCWTTTVIFWGAIILRGHSKIIVEKFDAELTWNIIRKLKPSCMFISPYQIATLCNADDRLIYESNSLETILIGGDTVFEHQLLLYRRVFPNTVVKLCFGLTECGAIIQFVLHTDKQVEFLRTKLKSIGSAVNGCNYKVVDVDTRKTLGPYQNGELLIKSDTIMSGYYNLDSSDVFDSDGWFKTGDIMYYDDDFYFYYIVRKKQMIKFRAYPLSPKHIEDVLCGHPRVKSVCVIGIWHKIDCEHPMALVELKDSSKDCELKKELCDLVSEKLEDRYHLRGGVKLIDKMPLTSTGKVDLPKVKRLVMTNQL